MIQARHFASSCLVCWLALCATTLLCCLARPSQSNLRVSSTSWAHCLGTMPSTRRFIKGGLGSCLQQMRISNHAVPSSLSSFGSIACKTPIRSRMPRPSVPLPRSTQQHTTTATSPCPGARACVVVVRVAAGRVAFLSHAQAATLQHMTEEAGHLSLPPHFCVLPTAHQSHHTP